MSTYILFIQWATESVAKLIKSGELSNIGDGYRAYTSIGSEVQQYGLTLVEAKARFNDMMEVSRA